MKTYDDVVAFHGHSCPGLALGYRVSLRMLREFGRRAADEEIAVMVENSSCSVDAVQVMTGCTFGKGNLIFRDLGKQVYTFFSRKAGRSLRIVVDWEKPRETAKEKRMWDRYRDGDRADEVLRFVHDRKASKVAQILEAPDDLLLKVTKGKKPAPPEARIYQSLRCAVCGEKTMEPRMRPLNGRLLCIPCFERKM